MNGVMAWLVVSCVAWNVAFDAHANDSAFGGDGSELIPLHETRIQMAAEDIVVTYDAPDDEFYGNGDWRIVARYTFVNPTDEAVTVQMGFPEARCVEDVDCSIRTPFRGMRTTVRGEAVQHRRGHVTLASQYESLGRVWLYDVTFQPNEQVQVVHTYRVHGWTDLSGVRSVTYITRTGALWAGPIGSARFRFRLPSTVADLEYTTEPAPQPVRLIQHGERAYTELEYVMRNWTPKNDLGVSFTRFRNTSPHRSGSRPALPRCPLVVSSMEAVAPDKVSELAGTWSSAYERAGLETCVRYVEAQYGKRFEDDAWNRFFYGPDGWQPGEPPFAFFRPNPGYDEQLFSREDRDFLQVLNQALDIVTPAAATAPSP